MTRVILLALALIAGTVAADARERLAWPVDCVEGRTCVVQQYVDLDPSDAVRDPLCGRRANDGHKGVDIRLLSFADLDRGVAVLAVADGVVLRVRNDAPDRTTLGGVLGPRLDGGLDCGNGLVVAHDVDGLETQYCHLRRGSIRAAPGDRVAAGQPLGEIGLSGATEFPHLHLTVTRDGAVVDPYTGAAVGAPCAAPAERAPLWAEGAAAPAAAATLLDAGFAAGAVDYGALSFDGPPPEPRDAAAPAIVFWARMLGLAAGDELRLEVFGPDGEAVAAHAETLPRDRAVQFLFTGRKRRGAAWPSGAYTGRVTLLRAGAAIVEDERRLAL